MGDKGVIMGGEVFATHGIRCGRLGNEAFQPTRMHVGVDSRYSKARPGQREDAPPLRAREAGRSGLAARPGPEVDRARAELAKAAAELRSQITELLGGLDADDGAIVEARGDIFPASSSRYAE